MQAGSCHHREQSVRDDDCDRSDDEAEDEPPATVRYASGGALGKNPARTDPEQGDAQHRREALHRAAQKVREQAGPEDFERK